MNDAREGRGTYKWKSGESICGIWRNNKLNGEVNYTLKGQTYNFKMEEGRLEG